MQGHAGAIVAGIAGSTGDIVPHATCLVPVELSALFNDGVLAFLQRLAW